MNQRSISVRAFMGTLALASVTLLVGCASTGTTSELQAYQKIVNEQNLRTEGLVFRTFPQIQVALMRHQAACGVNYQFAMEPDSTSYATISYQPDAKSDAAEAPLLAELVWYQPSAVQDQRVKISVYSQYASAAVNKRIDALFNAIDKPALCADAPDPDQAKT